ncbi:TPA: hypothetical protein ACHXAX_003603, partial [Escherichia coli]
VLIIINVCLRMGVDGKSLRCLPVKRLIYDYDLPTFLRSNSGVVLSNQFILIIFWGTEMAAKRIRSLTISNID